MKTTTFLALLSLLIGMNATAKVEDGRSACAVDLTESMRLAQRQQAVQLDVQTKNDILKKTRYVMDTQVTPGAALVGITRVAQEMVGEREQTHAYLTFNKDGKNFYVVAVLDRATNKVPEVLFPGTDGKIYAVDFER